MVFKTAFVCVNESLLPLVPTIKFMVQKSHFTVEVCLLLIQPRSCVSGKVRYDQICSCSLNSNEDFVYGCILIYPTVLRGSLHHGILTAHVVRCDGQVELFSCRVNNV